MTLGSPMGSPVSPGAPPSFGHGLHPHHVSVSSPTSAAFYSPHHHVGAVGTPTGPVGAPGTAGFLPGYLMGDAAFSQQVRVKSISICRPFSRDAREFVFSRDTRERNKPVLF